MLTIKKSARNSIIIPIKITQITNESLKIAKKGNRALKKGWKKFENNKII